MKQNKDNEIKKLIANIKKALAEVEEQLQDECEKAAKEISNKKTPARITIIFRGLELKGQDEIIKEATISWIEDIVPQTLAKLLADELGKKDRLVGFIDCEEVDIEIELIKE